MDSCASIFRSERAEIYDELKGLISMTGHAPESRKTADKIGSQVLIKYVTVCKKFCVSRKYVLNPEGNSYLSKCCKYSYQRYLLFVTFLNFSVFVPNNQDILL